MDIQVKLNSVKNEDKSTSIRNKDSNCKLPLPKKLRNDSDSNQTAVHSTALQSVNRSNSSLIKSINSKKSIDKALEADSERSIERKNLKFGNKKSDVPNDDEIANNHLQIANLITNHIRPNNSLPISTTPTTTTTTNLSIRQTIEQTNQTINSTTNKSRANLAVTTIYKLANDSNKLIINGPIVTDLLSNETIARTRRSIGDVGENSIENLRMYFEGWKDIPQCMPEILKKANSKNDSWPVEEQVFRFQLALQPVNDTGLNCGLMRMRNKITDELDYQHTIIIEYNEQFVDSKKNGQLPSRMVRTKKDALLVHCKMPKANFFQANQLVWWSSRMKQQMLDQERLLEEQERLLEERLKQTNNRSDNEQTIIAKHMMTRSNLSIATSDNRQNEKRPLTFDNGQLDKLDSNLSTISQATRHQRFKRASQQPFGSFLNSLPENFTESVDELIDYSGSYTGTTPIPKIHIAVRQNGNQFINSSLNVLPGWFAIFIFILTYFNLFQSQFYSLNKRN